MRDIPLFKVFCAPASVEAIAEIMSTGYIGQGPKVDEFEKLLGSRFDEPKVVTVNSGTSAEHLALHLLKKPHGKWQGMQRGDTVLATPLTCFATNAPILANGYKIKWVDVDPETLNMDMGDLERKIGPDTKAIMVVHWGGAPVDLDRLAKIQEKSLHTWGFKPAVIEDCAHAFGSTYKSKSVGFTGNLSTFSFQAIKHLTCGDGGMLVCPNRDLYTRAKLLRWYGMDREGTQKDMRCQNDVEEYGFKFHMNDINACIGIENLKHVNNLLHVHLENAEYYDANLPEGLATEVLDDTTSSYWLYTLRVRNRESFMAALADKGITTSRVHERNDIYSCVNEFKSFLPNLDIVGDEIVCIPVGWWVTPEDREYIVDTIKQGWI